MSKDLIRRSDAIKAVYKALKTPPLKGVLTDTVSLAIALVQDIPSADRPTVIRVKSIMKKEDYESLADSIRQQAPTAIVIPHNAELVTPVDRPQGEWIALDENDISGYWKCSACGTPTEAIGAKKLYKFCPNCGSKMRGEHDD